MLLTNVIFISVISFHCFGLLWLPTAGGHFGPFNEVLRKICQFVTRKMQAACCGGSRAGSKRQVLLKL